MNRSFFPSGARRRAMTLVEVSVVVAIVAVVLGLILQAMTDTERAVNDLDRGQLLRQEALLIAQAVDKQLRARVAPGDVGAAATAGMDAEKFAADQLRVCTLAAGGVSDKLFATIGTVADTDGARRVAIEYGLAGAADKGGRVIPGQNPDKVQSQITFRYLAAPVTGEPQWTDESGAAPAVVEYTIRLWPQDKRYGDYEAARRALGVFGVFEYVSGVALP